MARVATGFNWASDASVVTQKSDLQIWRRGGLGQPEVTVSHHLSVENLDG
jgi:hypothetical protein